MSVLVSLRLFGVVAALLLIPGVSPGAIFSAPGSPSPDASPWQSIPPPIPFATMYTIDLSSATEGWAGGMVGYMFHYSGGTWSPAGLEMENPINAIEMLSDTSGWGVTYLGYVIRYNGSTWTEHSRPTIEPLEDLSMLNEGDGWAVGGIDDSQHAVILHFNGSSWVPVSSPSTNWLMGVDMISASDGWAVGAGGTAWHYDGSSWQGGTVAPGVVFTAVDAVSTNDVWAVGMGGAIYHYDGSGWAPAASPTTLNLNSIEMLSAGNGWTVGDNGVILHYQNGMWSIVDSGTTRSLYAVSFVSPMDGWATGMWGVLLHYTGAPADLSTSRKHVDLTHAQPGARLTYSINLANSGDYDATGVVVTDPVPDETVYVVGSAESTQGTIYPPSGGSPLVVDVGTLAPGGSATITFQVDVGDAGQECWFVSNQASIVMDGSTPLTRAAITTMGTCHTAFLPVAARDY